MSGRTKRIAEYGLLTALALILSYVESLFPAFVAIPGIKIGLTNVVVLYALYRLGNKSAICINLVRIMLVAAMFSGIMGLAYSLAGGALSGAVMIALKRTNKLSIVTVSVIGGISHNIGQIIVAMLLLQTKAIATYLIILWFTGIISGIVVGIIAAEIVKRVERA